MDKKTEKHNYARDHGMSTQAFLEIYELINTGNEIIPFPKKEWKQWCKEQGVDLNE